MNGTKMERTRKKIILVDDTKANLDQGRNILKTFYEVFPVLSAAKMFEVLEKVTPDLILLDIEMPDMNGYEAIQKLKADPRYAGIPVIFLTSKDDAVSEVEGLDLGAADYVTKPPAPATLLKRVEKELEYVRKNNELLATQAELHSYLNNLEDIVEERTESITHLQNAVISTVVDMVEFRDSITGEHVVRTQQYLKALLEEMAVDPNYKDEIANWDISAIVSAAKLHDVGKIAVPDVLLSKSDRLSTEEFETIKAHVTVGVDIIERVMNKTSECDFLIYALRIAGTHHERWDGSGYPLGLKGNNIPLVGQLMAISDVYDALISARPYKEPLSHEEACDIIDSSFGSHFNPALMTIFDKAKDKFAVIAEEHKW